MDGEGLHQPTQEKNEKKDKFIQEMEKHGDAVITYRSAKSRKLKYNVCTMEFDNDYIQSKRNRAKPNQHQVYMLVLGY